MVEQNLVGAIYLALVEILSLNKKDFVDRTQETLEFIQMLQEQES